MSGEKLEWALKNGDVEEIKELLQKDKSLANAELARPPLCIAADYGQTDIVDILIDNGADVNKSDKYGITPLLSAIYEGHVATVKSLLSKGANKLGTAPDGSKYIDCAEKQEIKDMLN